MEETYFEYLLLWPVRPLNVYRCYPLSCLRNIDKHPLKEQANSLFDTAPLQIPLNMASHGYLTFTLLHLYISGYLHDRASTSIVWIFVRCFEGPSTHDIEDAWIDGFLKEISASQTEWCGEQIFDYSSVIGSLWYRRNIENLVHPPRRAWMRELSATLLNRLNGLPVLYPQVQRRKNMSHSTLLLYQEHFPNATEVRSLDLERHFYHHGEKILGHCEMRAAWKYNELKPRIYYAQGGDAYFSSRYMKRIAVAVMESIQATKVQNRLHPLTPLNLTMDAEDTVVTWDLSSFTTNLSELKYFLWHVARLCEDRAIEVNLFDYREGIITANLWELLDDYNSNINIQSSFSIHRILDKFSLDFEQSILQQQNSGMLGVPGNIGFSTALHGFVAQTCSEVNKTVCVGDDALCCTQDVEHVLETISSLGNLSLDKTSTLLPPRDELVTRRSKFLKRPFMRDIDGLYLDLLISLPVIPLIDGYVPPLRSSFLDTATLKDRIWKISSQVSSIYDTCFTHSFDIVDYEMKILLHYIFLIYQFLGLSSSGRVNGWTYKQPDSDEEFYMNFMLPPCHSFFDPRVEDWIDHLLDNVQDRLITIPRLDDRIPLPSTYMPFFYCTAHPLLTRAEDIQVIRMVRVEETIELLTEADRRKVKEWIRGSVDRFAVYEIHAQVDHFPSWLLSDPREDEPLGIVHNFIE